MLRHREQSMKRKQMYLSVFVVAILVLSTFAFVLSFKSPPQDLSYNGFEFRQKNNQWTTEINTPFGEKEYVFYAHPSELFIEIDPEIIAKIRQSPEITLAFYPAIEDIQYLEIARFELAQYLAKDLGKNVHNAITAGSSAYNLPIAACGPESGSLFITFSPANESTASISGNCIDIQSSNPDDYIRYAEKIIYQLLGVL